MKHIAIWKYFSSFETTSEEIDSSAFDNKLEQVESEIRALLSKHGLKLLSQEGRFIPMEKMSTCYCDSCGHLMINRDENPARFDGSPLYADLEFVILDGGNHEGRSLCQECLPISHRWGLFS
ncbi:hypothetical protein [Uliginosibacterium sp. 31-12]|uniref:hypothetical protein n=1 Tax=Uliginosibacterium sp. 31-12 TaxID=3062781 RepID=UPI0026E446A7|nr:hypothetical protein [Uliginosibacterium sp. 31-12]MDO6388476.1 hypothetical protein [Uliginosibacterium sp. 31-12]